ncbi:hypothetical protein AOXY_G27549 [Acipenser oxyrinchus oxyrinchus]|uniref:Immunoglobulin domain-containing protein n=1 Tax=Acipenser oxyrinchus oxyrinchus TaxID=40147 RepID=A0AAD8FS20_ACIOX|nr:hypothetical protein AOXY_G27549 [Acipenser oxyrinchus oxyrinchus]
MDIFNRALLVILTACCDLTALKGVDWDECMVTHVGAPASLPCSDWSVAGTLQAHWLWKPLSGESWLPVVSASERLADKELSSSGKFSLTFITGFQDAGRYACQGRRQEGTSRPSGRVTLLIIVSVMGRSELQFDAPLFGFSVMGRSELQFDAPLFGFSVMGRSELQFDAPLFGFSVMGCSELQFDAPLFGFSVMGRSELQFDAPLFGFSVMGRSELQFDAPLFGSPMPVPTDGTLRLSARVSDHTAKVSWISPKGNPLRSREDISGSILAKLPRVTWQEQGNYSCQVLVPGAPGRFVFNYTVTVRGVTWSCLSVAPSGLQRSGGAVAQSRVLIPCVTWPGADLILLYWKDPDARETDRVFEFDLGRRDLVNRKQPRLQLAESDPARHGNYSFLLTPDLEDNGVYRCEVFRDSDVYIQSFSLTVLQVWAVNTSVGLKLNCLYRGPTRVTAGWTFQNRSLAVSSTGPGSLYTEIAVNRSHSAPWQGKEGNYSCTVTVAGQGRFSGVYALTLPPAAATDPLQHPAESSRTLLGFLGAALGALVLGAAGILLWCKRGTCQRHSGIRRHPAPPSAEQDNLYENLEELRKEVFTGSDPHSSVYMDLRPRERDVYNELDRYQTCPR